MRAIEASGRAAPWRLTDYARRVFTLDVRSLALMRIAVATTVLVDLRTRLAHPFEHYADDGLVPRSTARVASWLADASLLSLSGSRAWVVVVFSAAIALSLLMLVGLRTRVVTPLVWLLVLSIQHRNPLLSDHRDALIACALFWGMLLPWGDAMSLDARRSRGCAGHACFGLPAVGYVLQIASVYLFAALLKTGPEWRTEGTAVELTLRLRYWGQPASAFLLTQPALTRALTSAVWWFEALLAPLLLVPWRVPMQRSLAVAGLVLMQIGFGICIWLETFPMIAIAMALGLLPASLWAWRERQWPSPNPTSADAAGSVSDAPRSRWLTALAAIALAYTLVLNLLSLTRYTSALTIAQRPAELVGMQQRWNMFAPSPTRVDGWFVVAARAADGSELDLLTRRAVDWSRPASFREGIRTTRELVYMRRLLAVDDARRESFVASRCRSERPMPVSIAVYFVPVIDAQQEPPEFLVGAECR